MNAVSFDERLLRCPDAGSGGGGGPNPGGSGGGSGNGGGGGGGSSMIRPPTPSISAAGGGGGGMGVSAKPASVGFKDLPAEPPPPKIQAFEQKMGRKHEDSWSRSPNVSGTGAIHVKSFHCKLNDEALVYIDQQVNEWLDAHPQYEVKLVTSTTGEWQGKLGKENHLVLQVWV